MNIFKSIMLPRVVKTGEEIKASDHNTMVRALQAILLLVEKSTVRSSADIGVKPGNHGGLLLFQKKKGKAGGEADAEIPPLTIVSYRPSYVPAPQAEVPQNHARFYLTWGMVNGVLADNWQNAVDVPTGAETSRHLVMKAYISPISHAIVVTRCEWLTLTQSQHESDAFRTPDWGDDGGRPDYVIIPLGQIQVSENGVATPFSTGGNINIIEYVSSIRFLGGGEVSYQKGFNITHVRY